MNVPTKPPVLWLQKLEKAIKSTTINFINPPRHGKKLLVLDIDYTIFDMRMNGADYMQAKRPYTDEMLTALYPYYDIVFWSQTSWRWLELKLSEMGILTHQSHKILFVLVRSLCLNCILRGDKM
jgi:ubiquitin-like domain-containing CTD phosphatase 1